MGKAVAYFLVALVLLTFFVAVQLLLTGVRASAVRLWLKKNYLKKRKEFTLEQLMAEAYIPPDVLSGERMLSMGCLPGILALIIMIIGAQSENMVLTYLGGGFFLFFLIPFVFQIGMSGNEKYHNKARNEFEARRKKCLEKLNTDMATGAGDHAIVGAYRRYWRASFNFQKVMEQKLSKKIVNEAFLADVKKDVQAAETISGSDVLLNSSILELKKQIQKLQRKS